MMKSILLMLFNIQLVSNVSHITANSTLNTCMIIKNPSKLLFYIVFHVPLYFSSIKKIFYGLDIKGLYGTIYFQNMDNFFSAFHFLLLVIKILYGVGANLYLKK